MTTNSLFIKCCSFICLTILCWLIFATEQLELTTTNITKRSQSDEVDILPIHYYRSVAPVLDGQPVLVKVSVVVLNIKIVSTSTQDYDMDLFYHNSWHDYRLQKPTNAESIAHRNNSDESWVQFKLSDGWRHRLWLPDTYFRNAISGSISNILTPTYYFTITNYREVFMAVRLNLKLTCDMNFRKFPFDTQTCFINITSTSEDMTTMKMSWETFRVGSHVDVSEFTVIGTEKKECQKEYEFGSYSCLWGKIVFKRNIGKYLIKRLIPSFIIVMITFTGCWIPVNIAPARISLPVTGLLALITQQIQSDLNVSYIYVLQVWNIVCIMFVFANLLEYATALYVMHRDQQRMADKQNELKKNDDLKVNHQKKSSLNLSLEIQRENFANDQRPSMVKRLREKLALHFRTNSRHCSIDIVCRYLFPLLYMIFIILFALYCYYK